MGMMGSQPSTPQQGILLNGTVKIKTVILFYKFLHSVLNYYPRRHIVLIVWFEYGGHVDVLAFCKLIGTFIVEIYKGTHLCWACYRRGLLSKYSGKHDRLQPRL